MGLHVSGSLLFDVSDILRVSCSSGQEVDQLNHLTRRMWEISIELFEIHFFFQFFWY